MINKTILNNKNNLSLQEIAEMYNTTVSALEELNPVITENIVVSVVDIPTETELEAE